MGEYEYDLFIIGGGSGGVRAARWASKKGLRVGLAEGERLGGTCVNVGCVPKKLFFHAAHVTQQLQDAQGFAWTIGQDVSHDWTQLKSSIDRYLLRLNNIYGKMLDGVEVTRYQAWAKLVDEHTIELKSSKNDEQVHTVTAQHILLAPGSKPERPKLRGIELGATSDDFFALSETPKSAIVIGGGYIGVEMAGVLSGLGIKTSLVYRSDLPLRGFDQDLRIKLDQALRSQMDVYSETSLEKIEKSSNGLKKVYLSNDSEVMEAEFILLATGRRPNSTALNLESVGIKYTDERDAIIVNEHYQTSIPHIYAVGDVTDRMQLTPVALAEAMRVVEHIVGGAMPPLNYDLVPTTVFSHPNLATVGLSEGEALSRGHKVQVYEADFRPLQQALQSNPKRVYMKMIVDQKTDRVLGCHMIGDEAGEQIQGLAVAMQAAVTKSQVDQTIGIHPTMAEEWVTMRTPRQA